MASLSCQENNRSSSPVQASVTEVVFGEVFNAADQAAIDAVVDRELLTGSLPRFAKMITMYLGMSGAFGEADKKAAYFFRSLIGRMQDHDAFIRVFIGSIAAEREIRKGCSIKNKLLALLGGDGYADFHSRFVRIWDALFQEPITREEAINRLAEMLYGFNAIDTALIAVDGKTAVGKTTFAKDIESIFADTVVVHISDTMTDLRTEAKRIAAEIVRLRSDPEVRIIVVEGWCALLLEREIEGLRFDGKINVYADSKTRAKRIHADAPGVDEQLAIEELSMPSIQALLAPDIAFYDMVVDTSDDGEFVLDDGFVTTPRASSPVADLENQLKSQRGFGWRKRFMASLNRQIWTSPGVLDPHYYDATMGELFSWRLESIIDPGDVVFDIGVGTGLLGLRSSMLGAKAVFGSDIHGEAVDLARTNYALAGMAPFVFEGDLMSAIKWRRYADKILFAPPWFESPDDEYGFELSGLDHAFFDPGYRTLRHFLQEAPLRLNPKNPRALCALYITERQLAPLFETLESAGLFLAHQEDYILAADKDARRKLVERDIFRQGKPKQREPEYQRRESLIIVTLQRFSSSPVENEANERRAIRKICIGNAIMFPFWFDECCQIERLPESSRMNIIDKNDRTVRLEFVFFQERIRVAFMKDGRELTAQWILRPASHAHIVMNDLFAFRLFRDAIFSIADASQGKRREGDLMRWLKTHSQGMPLTATKSLPFGARAVQMLLPEDYLKYAHLVMAYRDCLRSARVIAFVSSAHTRNFVVFERGTKDNDDAVVEVSSGKVLRSTEKGNIRLQCESEAFRAFDAQLPRPAHLNHFDSRHKTFSVAGTTIAIGVGDSENIVVERKKAIARNSHEKDDFSVVLRERRSRRVILKITPRNGNLLLSEFVDEQGTTIPIHTDYLFLNGLFHQFPGYARSVIGYFSVPAHRNKRQIFYQFMDGVIVRQTTGNASSPVGKKRQFHTREEFQHIRSDENVALQRKGVMQCQQDSLFDSVMSSPVLDADYIAEVYRIFDMVYMRPQRVKLNGQAEFFRYRLGDRMLFVVAGTHCSFQAMQLIKYKIGLEVARHPQQWLFLVEDGHAKLVRSGNDEGAFAFELARRFNIPFRSATKNMTDLSVFQNVADTLDEISSYKHVIMLLVYFAEQAKIDAQGFAGKVFPSSRIDFNEIEHSFKEFGISAVQAESVIRWAEEFYAKNPDGFDAFAGRFFNAYDHITNAATTEVIANELAQHPERTNVLVVMGRCHLPSIETLEGVEAVNVYQGSAATFDKPIIH